jgi:hypothetical protein
MRKPYLPEWAKTKYTKPRLCKDCLEEKPIEEFSFRDNGRSIYPCVYCRSCMSKRARAWALKNVEKFAAYQKKYWKTHGKKNPDSAGY